MTVQSIIKQHTLFSRLNDKEAEQLAQHANIREFAEGEHILRQFGRARNFYIVLSGKIALTVYASQRGAIPIHSIGVDDLLGWSWLSPPQKWHFDAVAMEDCKVIEFDAEPVRQLMEADPQLGYEISKLIIDALIHRLQASRMQLLDVYGEHTE